ncbi:DEAD/DEAH box helicase family protein [Jeotgalicoccus sp. WY2]|uniref:DEAD/DEAH box helicase family protein n=1 Tax=Jeotgalicoccus sp. WY2 TaxID=2708346 RepID=UPI002020ADF1|nr:DEAD/DEAH box helicase family protein [Jeotgalicoccus sp. WY2]
MKSQKVNLLNAYERGFIDRFTTKTSHHPPELIINSKEENVLSPMLDALETCESFVISVAFITEGGIASLKTVLYELNKRGIRGKIITSTYLNFNKPKVFKELLKIPNIDVHITDQAGFHAKGYVFDKKDYSIMFIGSSNLTDAALKKNYEYNLKLTSLDNGEVIQHFKSQFDTLWVNSTPLTEQWIRKYEKIYAEIKHDDIVLQLIETKKPYRYDNIDPKEITPNLMQEEALDSLKNLRLTGEKKGLVVSATGTGKTYLSAFDVRNVKPERVLFIAHREQILMKSNDYRDLLGGDPADYGIYSGSKKDINAKYMFATVQIFLKKSYRTIPKGCL